MNTTSINHTLLSLLIAVACGACTTSNTGDETPAQNKQVNPFVHPTEPEQNFCDDSSPDEEHGSILFSHWAVDNGTLRLIATFKNLAKMSDRYDNASVAKLEIRRGADAPWLEVATADIQENIGDNPLWIARFEVANWDEQLCAKYRVTYEAPAPLGGLFTGQIQRSPKNEDEFIVATANCYGKGGPIILAEARTSVKSLIARDPDMLFLAGDQVYRHTKHFSEWRMFGKVFRDLMRNVPTVAITDDHDVGQANLWGAIDTEAPETNVHATNEDADSGGFHKSNAYVNVSQLSQSGVLPDPPDYGDGLNHGAPVPTADDELDLNVYYTALSWGGISFAILEDRKFKEGPQEVLHRVNPNFREDFADAFGGRWDHLIKGADALPASFSEEPAELLGSRQQAFLEKWSADWRDGAQMKVVLSQTPFLGFSTHHGKEQFAMEADLDANGWPKSGRDAALRAIRKGFAFHLVGDQHLGGLVHYGVDDFEDAGFVYIVPSVNSVYGRQWQPAMLGRKRFGQPEDWPSDRDPILHGRYKDGFQNHMTVWAHAQGDLEGVGYVVFNKKARTITTQFLERGVAVPANQEPPASWATHTHNQLQGYARTATHTLPTLNINVAHAVVQVVKESTGEVVYTLRVKGHEFQPKVFAPGTYRINVAVDDVSNAEQVLNGLAAAAGNNSRRIDVVL